MYENELRKVAPVLRPINYRLLPIVAFVVLEMGDLRLSKYLVGE